MMNYFSTIKDILKKHLVNQNETWMQFCISIIMHKEHDFCVQIGFLKNLVDSSYIVQ